MYYRRRQENNKKKYIYDFATNVNVPDIYMIFMKLVNIRLSVPQMLKINEMLYFDIKKQNEYVKTIMDNTDYWISLFMCVDNKKKNVETTRKVLITLLKSQYNEFMKQVEETNNSRIVL